MGPSPLLVWPRTVCGPEMLETMGSSLLLLRSVLVEVDALPPVAFPRHPYRIYALQEVK